MPIHRLDEKPTALGTLADLTCDSDGKIDRFITTGTEDTKSLLELHVPEPDKPYYLGMFLAGAYQVRLFVSFFFAVFKKKKFKSKLSFETK